MKKISLLIFMILLFSFSINTFGHESDSNFNLQIGLLPGIALYDGFVSFDSIGIGIDFSFYKKFGFSLNYMFRGKEYYRYNHEEFLWEGPLTFSSVNESNISSGDWIFFQTKHTIFTYSYLRFGDKGNNILLGYGWRFNFLAPSDAYNYYPDFKDKFIEVGDQYFSLTNAIILGYQVNFKSFFIKTFILYEDRVSPLFNFGSNNMNNISLFIEFGYIIF